MARIVRLKAESFTCFGGVDFSFGPGVNVLFGGNGTGKTHALKLLYCLENAAARADEPGRVTADALAKELVDVFLPQQLRGLASNGGSGSAARVEAVWQAGDGTVFSAGFTLDGKTGSVSPFGRWPSPQLPTYIPPKDMLAHSKGFAALWSDRYLSFDRTFVDILSKAGLPALKGPFSRTQQDLIRTAARALPGKVASDSAGNYYLVQKGSQRRLEMGLVAEGWRKLSLLSLLAANGALGGERSLFWDEPEANLNPSLLFDVLETLVKAVLDGSQVFLATHSDQAALVLGGDPRLAGQVRFHGLSLQEESEFATNGSAPRRKEVQVRTFDRYEDLEPNLVREASRRLLHAELDRLYGPPPAPAKAAKE